eukprot:6472139-Amphidinium_carterae.1
MSAGCWLLQCCDRSALETTSLQTHAHRITHVGSPPFCEGFKPPTTTKKNGTRGSGTITAVHQAKVRQQVKTLQAASFATYGHVHTISFPE